MPIATKICSSHILQYPCKTHTVSLLSLSLVSSVSLTTPGFLHCRWHKLSRRSESNSLGTRPFPTQPSLSHGHRLCTGYFGLYFLATSFAPRSLAFLFSSTTTADAMWRNLMFCFPPYLWQELISSCLWNTVVYSTHHPLQVQFDDCSKEKDDP